MRFDIFTLFTSVFQSYFDISILRRAIEAGLVEINLYNIRDWTIDKHHVTDEPPFGGGGGMVMKPEPVFKAIQEIIGIPPACPVILMTPQGRTFNQRVAQELAAYPRLGLLCGRYEGVDERIRQHLVTDEISIGDYVLTGGELPALILMDAITRLIPGALGDPDAAIDDSHATGLLEYPHYTRPASFRSWDVPAVLLSGNHAQIARWRREQSLLRTWQRRPDLLETAALSNTDREFLERLKANDLDQRPENTPDKQA
ncbi:MAG: tRNA (guanosine(37)-N1)-methyltransferase TrmD [Planctomycetes bacterium]|nr:tRNA (guanosine(37)-N1)-methyltransferase TrmD [Planctomycetota bacterium]